MLLQYNWKSYIIIIYKWVIAKRNEYTKYYKSKQLPKKIILGKESLLTNKFIFLVAGVHEKTFNKALLQYFLCHADGCILLGKQSDSTWRR